MITTKSVQRQAKRLFHLCLANGALDEERVRQVLQYLFRAGCRDSIRILASFARLVRLDRRQHTATVESAAALPAEVKAEIQTALAHAHGRAITSTFAERASLIGGVRIQAGWNVYDGTVSAQLERLARTF